MLTCPPPFVILSSAMKKFIGDRQFYRRLFQIGIPIIVQNGISNFVNLLDNIMVGQVGTEPMTGVSIVNQLIFVFNLALFGAVSGPGIFTAQYVGQKNHEGVRYTVRLKLIMVTIISLVGSGILYFFKENLIMLFLHNETGAFDPDATLGYAVGYLMVILIGMLPFAITQSYAGTLREEGETNVPMIAGLIAVFVNLIFNYILIFGHFGAPKLGVIGAAAATVLSRFVELFIVVIWTHTHKERNPFAEGLYKGFRVPGYLTKKVILTGAPLFFNEFLWSLGMSALTQCYSMRGIEVVAAFNIANTINNLFNVVLISMGTVVSIIIGQVLGSGNLEEVVDTDRKLIFASVFASAVMALLLIATAGIFPRFYNTTDEIRALSASLMRVGALFMPVGSFLNAAYFTIRSGGKTFITFLFDSCYLWVLAWPIGYVLSRFTGISILPMYAIILSLDFVKAFIGVVLLKKKIWIQNLVA